MPTDFKKTEKDLYQPGVTPSLINVPEMNYIAVDGKGDPNRNLEYADFWQQNKETFVRWVRSRRIEKAIKYM